MRKMVSTWGRAHSQALRSEASRDHGTDVSPVLPRSHSFYCGPAVSPCPSAVSGKLSPTPFVSSEMIVFAP